MKFKIASDVFYRLYGDHTLLYRTGSKMVYLFNASAKEILDCFLEETDVESCLAVLEKKYGYSEDIRAGVVSFIDQIYTAGVLVKENVLVEDRNNAEVLFKDQFMPENTLYSVLFELTFRCNERCRHCYCVQDDKNELTTQEVMRVLDELAEMNVFEVTFTGGDLFVRKDVFEILEYAYRKRFLISIFTNGIALEDRDFLRLKAIYPKAIHFSLYSHIAEKHDAFTQVKGSFEKTIAAIKKCVLLNIPVNIKTTAMEYNYEDIEGLLTLAKRLGTTIQVGMSVNAKNNGDLSPVQFRIDSIEKYSKIIKLIGDNIEFCGDEALYPKERDRICGAGKHALSINPYGEVFPCNALLLSSGNVLECPLKEIWNGSNTLQKVRSFTFSQIKGCEGCSSKIICNFCPGAAWAETGDPLQRFDEPCNLMKAKKLAENL